jgi:nondiscriminating aspartyl-tRNA synthetase
MTRTKIGDLSGKVGESVSVSAWVDVRRDQGKMVFLVLRDGSGSVQSVVLPDQPESIEVAHKLRPEWVVKVQGEVVARPAKNVKEGEPNGGIELCVKGIEVLSEAKELPFDTGAELNIDTHLDHLPLTLRQPKAKATFKVQSEIIGAFRDALREEGCVEIQAPKLIGEDAEGGANSFSLEYFGHTAHLAQSPQFYKQIMVGIFERVFAAGNVYRAEKHATTRHLNEYTSLDAEIGFIESFRDVMALETRALAKIMARLKETCAAEFALHGAEIPAVPEQIPSLTLREAQELIFQATGEDCRQEPDLEPAHERWLCDYAKEKLGSDFIFVTHFPLSKRPMYTHEDPENPGYAAGFDLLFRGVEITTGGQRVHDYDKLVAAIEKKGLNPEQFSYYLQAFKYGMPPHGGFGMGLERLTAKLLGIQNVKEATLFPRDINRIDGLLNKQA